MISSRNCFQQAANIEQCVDIEFAEPGDKKIPEVNESNCFNSTELGFAEMFTIATVNPSTGKRYDEAESLASTVGQHLGWLSMAAVGGLWALL